MRLVIKPSRLRVCTVASNQYPSPLLPTLHLRKFRMRWRRRRGREEREGLGGRAEEALGEGGLGEGGLGNGGLDARHSGGLVGGLVGWRLGA